MKGVIKLRVGELEQRGCGAGLRTDKVVQPAKGSLVTHRYELFLTLLSVTDHTTSTTSSEIGQVGVVGESNISYFEAVDLICPQRSMKPEVYCR